MNFWGASHLSGVCLFLGTTNPQLADIRALHDSPTVSGDTAQVDTKRPNERLNRGAGVMRGVDLLRWVYLPVGGTRNKVRGRLGAEKA